MQTGSNFAPDQEQLNKNNAKFKGENFPPDWLRKYDGFENVNEEEALRTIEGLERLCDLFYELYLKQINIQ